MSDPRRPVTVAETLSKHQYVSPLTCTCGWSVGSGAVGFLHHQADAVLAALDATEPAETLVGGWEWITERWPNGEEIEFLARSDRLPRLGTVRVNGQDVERIALPLFVRRPSADRTEETS